MAQVVATRLQTLLGKPPGPRRLLDHLPGIAISVLMIAVITACLIVARRAIDVRDVSIVYLIPVLVSATRWGLWPAIVAAVVGVAASAFFFYPPIFSLQIYNPQQLIDTALFVFVAVVTSQLADQVRKHVQAAERRESELRSLYAFSRRLAVASTAEDIYAAIQAHLSSVTGCRVAYFDPAAGSFAAGGEDERPAVPEDVEETAQALTAGRLDSAGTTFVELDGGDGWLVRTVLPGDTSSGVLAVNVGRVSEAERHAMRRRIEAVLDDAAATFERLGVARAIGEARVRAEAETLRDAVIGSVSHELRTPLSSIMGSASVLAQSPAVSGDPRLAALAGIVRDEADRLDGDIQKLLDAGRIVSAAVRPHFAWADPSDIVNAALTRREKRLADHRLSVRMDGDLPLVRVDPVLVENALGQILDNAAKYSPQGSTIDIAAAARDSSVAITVADSGMGLEPGELARVFERFYRGPRSTAGTSGSGLGLWIARAFVAACGGDVLATTPGPGRGACFTIVLPCPGASPAGSPPGD